MKLLIGAGFTVLTILFFGLLISKLQLSQKARRNSIIGIVLWALFLAIWSLSGMAMRFDLFPLNMTPVLVIPLVAIIIITIKSKDVLRNISPKVLINLQVFRVFVELLLWASFAENLIPVQMTFEGRNFDIISGLTAPFAAMFLARSKWGLAIWNVMCLGLLVNILTVAILSMPGPLRVFFNEPANTVVATFPFILLPGMLVPLAYGLSLLSLRQIFSLTSQNEETSTPASHSGSLQHN